MHFNAFCTPLIEMNTVRPQNITDTGTVILRIIYLITGFPFIFFNVNEVTVMDRFVTKKTIAVVSLAHACSWRIRTYIKAILKWEHNFFYQN